MRATTVTTPMRIMKGMIMNEDDKDINNNNNNNNDNNVN
jgi:hypothetical protein